ALDRREQPAENRAHHGGYGRKSQIELVRPLRARGHLLPDELIDDRQQAIVLLHPVADLLEAREEHGHFFQRLGRIDRLGGGSATPTRWRRRWGGRRGSVSATRRAGRGLLSLLLLAHLLLDLLDCAVDARQEWRAGLYFRHLALLT